MSIMITWGWWLVPTLITIAAFGWFAWYWRGFEKASGGYGKMVDGLIALGAFALALVIALVAWLIWALFR